MPGNRRARYTEEFKAEAVQLARSSSEKSMRQLAYEIGVADQTLRDGDVSTETGQVQGLNLLGAAQKLGFARKL